MNNEFTIDFAGCAGGVEGLGPGKRAVMWVRGCPLACPGCMTPELWAKGTPLSFKSIEHVKTLLQPLLANVDGLTISGGEPMEQPIALRNLVRLLRKEFPNLNVLVYSGYDLEELRKRNKATQEFLREIDILIDRPFVQAASNTLAWRGSDNQRVHYLTERVSKHSHEEAKMPETRPLQIQMLEKGQFRIIGIPKRGDMTKYRKIMDSKGIRVRKGTVAPTQCDSG